MSRLGDRTVWTRHSFRLGKAGDGGDWSEDDAVSHAVEMGRTICGVTVPHSPDGRWMQDLWARRADALFVTCRRCRRVLEREAVRR